MRHWLFGSLFAAALSFTAPAAAQDKLQKDDGAEIVVTGQRDVERQARDFVAALTPSRPGGQLARFESDVCPAVVGLGISRKAAVEQRLRLVAEAAGMTVGKADCTPNAILMLADDKRAFLDALRRHRPDYFGNLSLPERRRLTRAPGPTAAWQLQGQVTARGTPIDPSNPVNRTTEPPSRMTAAARPVFEASALVIEKGALDGLSTTQLADYAAMRLFAKTSPERLTDSAAPTIVKILDVPMGGEVPLTLTQWDLGYLRGLYASPHNLYSGAQRSAISRGITTELRRSDDGGEEAE